MGWLTAYVELHRPWNGDEPPAELLAIANRSFARTILLPGSESISLQETTDIRLSEPIPRFRLCGFGACKVQASLNPNVSQAFILLAAQAAQRELGPRARIVVRNDYGLISDDVLKVWPWSIWFEILWRSLLITPLWIALRLVLFLFVLIATLLRPRR